VLEVVKAMNGNKLLGLDGFSMALFQTCCVDLKKDIMKIVWDFHAGGKFERNLNATFIAPISKILGYLISIFLVFFFGLGERHSHRCF
jgi:hypothetical protein